MKPKTMEGKMKLIRIQTTKEYKDKNGNRVIHCKTIEKEQQPIYFSNPSNKIENWDKGGGYIDFAPKGNFITKFLKRIWNYRKWEKYLLKE